ncbi:putative UDP-GlcNAc:betaGal beta-1,3-N-acetylglucosaminyltransferase LOC100288842 [Sinocyclocheilus rhinocerous]|uniref:putative UDP-GlcNAc:betaGal beta-1,3-N-acetylglucosaminyltransferase LOC100288842 n=1 Tax=Sinocyclocheilus rhinocerous TaxID=307959 RepID=UPI0007B967E5|nr:PREDICTED: putative UDP-GlcNAc:betaGal beta-1,3-N-acetylglucosaminyltransferase LOC100288842 [Sinocyclocheilus rhinocerous]
MKICVFRLQTHQWCFLLCNVILFHALLFGGDIVEEFLLQSSPAAYTDRFVLEVRERARKLDLTETRLNTSQLYPINSEPCLHHQDLLILTLVLSSPGNSSQREAVRNSWANQTSVHSVAVRTLFFLGSSHFGAELEMMREESARYARFIVLSEDSVYLNLPALTSYLLGLRTHPDDLYLGRVIHRAAPERDPDKPHYLPYQVYPEKYLPDYCSGPAFLLSQDVVRKVYVAAEDVSLPLPSDVLIGLCARRAGVVATHSARFSGDRHIRYNPCCYNFLFSSAGMGVGMVGVAWRDLGAGKGRSCGMLETYYSLVVCKAMTYLDQLSFLNNDKSQG